MSDYVNHNPDILTCLANLSNDEVFTPPELANQVLDLIPQDFWADPNVKVLDPACKSGVFPRECAKRFLKGLEPVYPDLQDRIDHIFQKQLFGYAITELTSYMSRRSVYCSKTADGKYSVSHFERDWGNINYKNVDHTWKDGKCTFCGAPKEVYGKGKGRESYAYRFIHLNEKKIKELQDMKFDLIISNPPYQLDTAGAGKQAKPIYNLFVNQAKKLQPRYLVMIIPSRWFAGGMGLDSFRSEMMNDNHITSIVDYTNSKDCFPGISVSGGVCYFKWDREKTSDCDFVNVINGCKTEMPRPLNEFSVLIRYNKAIPIIHKIKQKKETCIDTIISSLMPYGLSTSFRGCSKSQEGYLKLHSSEGVSFISPDEIKSGFDSIEKYKILVSKTSAEHAGEPGKDGRFKVIPSSMKVLGPKEVCTHSYFIIGNWNDVQLANNALIYLKTRFVRFLMLQCISGFGLSKIVFPFVPLQDFSKPWTDEELYKKYDFTEEEIAFIESMIKPMDLETDDE